MGANTMGEYMDQARRIISIRSFSDKETHPNIAPRLKKE